MAQKGQGAVALEGGSGGGGDGGDGGIWGAKVRMGLW